LILEARRRYPHLPVCYMTGYAEEPGLKDVPLVRKPFQAHELLNTVNQVAEETAGAVIVSSSPLLE
jgi:hypothetical protein